MKRILPILLLLAALSPASAYTAYKTVSFGPTQTAQTVTYTVKDSTNTTVSAGVSGTVIELGGGAYASAITVPDGANYFIVWSETNAGTTYIASDRIEAQATMALATLANQTAIITQTAKIGTNAADSPNEAAAQAQATNNGAALATANAGIAALPTASAILASIKADSQFSIMLNRQKQRFLYVPSTRSYQPLLDDGTTSFGSPLIISVDALGNILQR